MMSSTRKIRAATSLLASVILGAVTFTEYSVGYMSLWESSGGVSGFAPEGYTKND